jgi:hypothetical protein
MQMESALRTNLHPRSPSKQPPSKWEVSRGAQRPPAAAASSISKLKNQVTETNVPRELKILHVSLIPELLTTFSSIAIVIIDGPCVNARTFNLHSDSFCFDRIKYNF